MLLLSVCLLCLLVGDTDVTSTANAKTVLYIKNIIACYLSILFTNRYGSLSFQQAGSIFQLLPWTGGIQRAALHGLQCCDVTSISCFVLLLDVYINSSRKELPLTERHQWTLLTNPGLLAACTGNSQVH
jgi:hypothetical protein